MAAFSRRHFMMMVAAAGALASVDTSFATASQNVKTLRLASGQADGVKGTLDPALATTDADSARIVLVYQRLVDIDETFTPTPQLATEWTSNSDATVWTFKLRKNVKFHDGSPFTAKDVLFTYRRILDPSLASSAASSLKQVDPNGIVAVDDFTVEFRLKEPVVEFPLLTANRFNYIVKADQTLDQLRTSGIGTGGFKVERFVPGEDPSTFVKYDSYWEPGLPKVDRVELRSIADNSARVAALLAGQVDITWNLPVQGIKRLEGRNDIKLISIPTAYWYGLAVWADTKPFDDVRVRQALKLVADREQLLKAVLNGHGRIAADQPVAPGLRYAIEASAPKQDIQKAKELLAAAGHPDGIDVELYTSTNDNMDVFATVYKAQAAKAGIRVNIVKAPPDDYWVNIWLKKPALTTAWSGRAADEALSLEFLSTANWNETHWRNAEFDGYIAEARKTLDVSKRTELYQKAQRLIQEDGGALVAFFGDSLAATKSNISGWKPHPQSVNLNFNSVTIND